MPKLEQSMMSNLFFDKEIYDDRVVVGPSYGEDAAVLKFKDEYLVAHPDPISGAVKNIGWLSINISANDIAVTGAEPRWAMPSLQIPEKFEKKEVQRIIEDLYQAADELGVTLIGGHTETVKGIDRPLVTTAMMGVTEKPVLTRGSNSGDKIVQVNEAAIEGTWILVSDFEDRLLEKGLEKNLIDEVKRWGRDISVVKDALKMSENATSMHDPTEGGILQGIYEMAKCSGNDFVIDEEISFRSETIEVSDVFRLDPKKLISSGCLLATIPEEKDIELGKVIGHVESGSGQTIFEGDVIEEVTEDELFRFISDME
ncbi:MAG: AIR synthase related protein [Thermoplasmatota archaeon]